MKILFLALIDLYQDFFSTLFKNLLGASTFCRFNPTCSEYAKKAIQEKGALTGGYLLLIRLLKCQPFYNER